MPCFIPVSITLYFCSKKTLRISIGRALVQISKSPIFLDNNASASVASNSSQASVNVVSSTPPSAPQGYNPVTVGNSGVVDAYNINVPTNNPTAPINQPYVNPYACVRRKDPCPCGSGKKFKHCHGKH